MKILHEELDSKPTKNKVMQMVDTRIQNLLCFKELKNYNDTGKWLFVHPLLQYRSDYTHINDLRRRDPQEFLRQYALTESNIKRYSSYLKSPTREDKRKADKINLKAHEDRAKIYKTILENDKND